MAQISDESLSAAARTSRVDFFPNLLTKKDATDTLADAHNTTNDRTHATYTNEESVRETGENVH